MAKSLSAAPGSNEPSEEKSASSSVVFAGAADTAEWLRVTLSSIGDGVITSDGRGLVTFLNPVAESLTGWVQADAMGQPLDEVFRIVNEETRATVENPALRALREGVIMGLANHTLLISRDGTERPIDDSAAPIRNHAGVVAGAVLVFRDITERRATEQKLLRSEVRYRRLFQTAKDGILILDAASGKIIDANAFMSALVGVEPGALIGRELYQIGMLGDVTASKAAFERLQANNYIRFDHLPIKNQRGEKVEVEFIANVYEEAGRMVAQCNVRDISDRARLERKVKEQTAALADESRRKDEFLAMLSHELRNPLAPIRSAVYLLRSHADGTESPIEQQARGVIERQVANLTKLVSDLLEVSRVVSGRIRLNFQLLDIHQAIEHAVQTADPLFEQRRHRVITHLSEGPVWVQADPTRIEEILVNLLNNAAKYTPDGGEIHVRCELASDSTAVLVRISDNGIGLDPSQLEGGRIFDLFTQADRSLDRAAGGLGIGLSLVHRLVVLHGGTVEASSDGPGKGSEFVVRLPLAAKQPSTVGLASPRVDRVQTVAAPSTPNGVRVLVVDDNVDLVAMLTASLSHLGYSVRFAHTGPEGLRIAQESDPDVVLLDIGLPGLDGYEVARRLRRSGDSERAPFRGTLVALTGYGRASDVALAREAGFDGHMVKPYDFEELEKLISANSRRVT